MPEHDVVEDPERRQRVLPDQIQTDQTGDPIAGPTSVVVRLILKVLKTGSTEIGFDGATGSNTTDDPTAVDSSGNPIGTIAFDEMPATLIGR